MSCFTAVPLTLYKDSYRDTEVEDEEDQYVVVAKGNTHTSMDRVQDYALLRAAQIMKKEGFKYFVVSKEIQDFASTKVVYGNVEITNSDSRNPVTGLLITGHNEKPKLEDKKSKAYKTAEVLEEYSHYVDEAPPKEFNGYMTVLAGSLLLSCVPLIYVIMLL
jgi:hypothetical protein